MFRTGVLVGHLIGFGFAAREYRTQSWRDPGPGATARSWQAVELPPNRGRDVGGRNSELAQHAGHNAVRLVNQGRQKMLYVNLRMTAIRRGFLC